MNKVLLGILLTVLAYTAYPNRVILICTALPEASLCKKPEPVPVEVAAPKPPVQIHKWVDDQGVVHYGENSSATSERIDETLEHISVIGGGGDAMQQNLSAAKSIRSSTGSSRRSSYSSSSYSKYKREAKKKRCAKIAANRDKYTMRSGDYRSYSSQYSNECIL